MILIDQLVSQGVTKFCIAPGSRSAPLALAAASHPQAETTVHFDERGLGFYALGLSKGSKKPVAIITTSGTAVANLLPSVMEAFHSFTPLILLTADRPHELRNCGANQTTDQVKLFSNVIRAEIDLSPHLDEKSLRSIIAHHVFLSLQNPPGPVHINCPLYESLEMTHSKHPPIPFSIPTLSAAPFHTQAKRGIILLGAMPTDPHPVLELAKRLQWPVFGDLLSCARTTPSEEQIHHFDYLIRSKKAPKPDLILHFGGRFISKHLPEWEKEIPTVHVSPYPSLQDPARRHPAKIQSDIEPFCKTFQANTDLDWLPLWQKIDTQMKTILDTHFQSPFTEAHAIRSLPLDNPIFFGNSMPIRDADHFLFPAPQVFANRGVSGIDGNIATAVGIADALKKPLTLFIGDQTALHDLNSLPLIKNRPIRLIISNNFGGGIFDYLPVSKTPHLETLFTAAHTWHFEGAAKMFGIPYVRRTKEIEDLPLYGIIELITDRKENHRFQQELLGLIATL